MRGKIALIIDYECDKYIKLGNTTILTHSHDFILELMGLQEGGKAPIQQQIDDEEILEVNLQSDAAQYLQISYGAKTIIIGKDYTQFKIECSDNYQENLYHNHDIVIAFKDQDKVLEEIQSQQKYHIYFIISNITQYDNDIQFPLQSRNQFKFQEIQNNDKQIALIHYSNYQMRVDEIESLEQINQFSYIRRNIVRLQCLWRELLTQIGKFPKYGA